METKLTVIIDNNAHNTMKGEWGLSILVEYGGKKLLADAGGSELFAENLARLGFDMADIDYATLSHAHYDHANGMPRFLRDNQKAKLYVRETTCSNCYARKKFMGIPFKKYIGIPRQVLKNYSDRIAVVSGDYKICEGIWLIPHKTPGLEAIGMREHMYQRTPQGWVPDNFSHEQSLVVDTDKGLVIINCCCHGGAVNIIREVRETFPGENVYALIGGLHLFNKAEDEIREVSRQILDTGIALVSTGHCTGQRAYNIMKEELGDRLCQLHVGLEMRF